MRCIDPTLAAYGPPRCGQTHSARRYAAWDRLQSFDPNSDQNPDRQLDHLEVDRVFTDKASAKDAERPQLKALLSYAREGDTIVIHSMDRLAISDK
jgi:hypothetical protein